jgi:hypothetical protein
MKAPKTFLEVLWVLVLVLGPVSFVKASTGTNDFEAQAAVDFQKITDFINSPFQNSLGFFTGLGWNGTPGVFDLTASPLGGGPHFELGLGVGADVIGLPSLSTLNLSAIDASSNISLPGWIPIPFPVITARIGLFNGLDIGARCTYLPPVAVAGINAKYTGWGLDLRYKVLDGLQVPTVTVGMSFDSLNGNVSIATNVNQSSSYYDANDLSTYNVVLTGTTTYALDWNTRSVGAKISVGKGLGILYPFAAIGFQRNEGSVTSTLTGNYSETLSGGANNGSANSVITGKTVGAPVVLEPKYVLGFDIGGGLGLHWSVVGESNGTDIAGSTAIRGQF